MAGMVRAVIGVLTICLEPGRAWAGAEAPLDLPLWSMTPFVFLLVAIAVLPLVAEHWWHSNRNKAIISFLVAVPTVLYLAYVQRMTGQATLAALGHEMFKYVSFIILLGSLFTVAGGIVVRGDLRATPLVNASFLGIGSVLANLIGTTGASVLLIRPVLRINRQRRHTRHLPVFFIFVVSNVGGLLTPLGDPPLFLGFLHGVPFVWTLTLWPQWLFVNLLVILIFFLWDHLAYRRESPEHLRHDRAEQEPLRLQGLLNAVFLVGIMVGVLMQRLIPGEVGEMVGSAIMLIMGLLSWRLTPRALRDANGFNWTPIIEVAVLFLGIFVAMVPALEILKARGAEFGITEPWQFFWLTGGLSAVLDNAPTYLAFATIAAGPNDIGSLVQNHPELLAAISSGAVFMGAITYIGNGPNFMVKAIAEESGYRMPSFFGYVIYSSLVLLPVLAAMTWLWMT